MTSRLPVVDLFHEVLGNLVWSNQGDLDSKKSIPTNTSSVEGYGLVRDVFMLEDNNISTCSRSWWCVAGVCFRCKVKLRIWKQSCDSPRSDWIFWRGKRRKWVIGSCSSVAAVFCSVALPPGSTSGEVDRQWNKLSLYQLAVLFLHGQLAWLSFIQSSIKRIKQSKIQKISRLRREYFQPHLTPFLFMPFLVRRL